MDWATPKMVARAIGVPEPEIRKHLRKTYSKDPNLHWVLNMTQVLAVVRHFVRGK